VSSSSSSSAETTPTAFPYACPANNGQTVVDQAGNSYVLGCGCNTNHGPYAQRPANTFNDCFQMCDDEAGVNPGNASCTGFVFFNGACQLREKDDQDFSGEGYDPALVAAIRLEAYAGNVMSTSSSSSLAGLTS
jgi:hypothetical protein